MIVYSEREGLSESAQVQGLPAAILNCLPPYLRNFPAEWKVSISEETIIQQVAGD